MKNKKYLFLLVLIVPIIVFFVTRSFSLEQEIKSVEIQSDNYNDPGSWHIDKSAEWISYDKARVTFDIDSILKSKEGRYKDVILVMDISGSMVEDKLNKAKSDAIGLIEYLLGDANNSISLITFSTTSEIKKGFTKDKNELISLVNNLTADGVTNYNSALKNVDIVMNDYQEKDNTDLIVLFLTDGYPNEETPNEKSTYQLLKDKYSYMTVSGVQYEMGEEVIPHIVDISDYQYIAYMTTLKNVLFDAVYLPEEYENYTVTDYIDNDYFYIESIDDVEVSLGEVRLEEENGIPKIIWNLGENYKTGSNIKMSFILHLKDEFLNVEGFYSTNKQEKIQSKNINEDEIIISSELTPVLRKIAYNVIYDPNPPQGCELSNYANEKYFAFQVITKKDYTPKCTGYVFKGWKIKDNDRYDMSIINDDTFMMPEHDVTINAVWTKQDLVKMMDGTVKTVVPGILKRTYSSDIFGEYQISRNSVESIITIDEIEIPETALGSWDASEEQNGSVMVWYTDVDNNGLYELYIGQEGGVIANPDSSYAFSNYSNVKLIDLSNYNIKKVRNMERIFNNTAYSSSQIRIIGLSDLDVSNVENLSYAFYSFGYRNSDIDLEIKNWKLNSNVDAKYMFSNFGYSASKVNLDLTGWDLSEISDTSYMFYDFASNTRNIKFIVKDWDTSGVENMSNMFNHAMYYAANLDLDFSTWNTSNVKDMSHMFYNFVNTGYGTLKLDFTGWDTSNVTDMNGMFYMTGCYVGEVTNGPYGTIPGSKVELIGLSNWKTSKVENMNSMFSGVGKYAETASIGNLSSWNTSNVTNMSNMFYQFGFFSKLWDIGDLSNWDTSKVEDMSYMLADTGYYSTTMNSIGTLKVYASKINRILSGSPNIKATVNIYSNPTITTSTCCGGVTFTNNNYEKAFYSSAYNDGAYIIVNYSSNTTNVDNIIATGSGNIIKGDLLD